MRLRLDEVAEAELARRVRRDGPDHGGGEASRGRRAAADEVHKGADRRGRGERHGVDPALAQLDGKRAQVGGRGHGAIDRHHLDDRSTRPEPGGQGVTRVLRAGDQHATPREAAAGSQRLGQGFADELVGDECGRHAALGERVAGGGPDRRHGRVREGAGAEAPGEQPVEDDLDGVLTGEYDPAVGGEAGERGAQRAELRQRLDADDRREHHGGAVRFEGAREITCLLARAGDYDAAPFQCT